MISRVASRLRRALHITGKGFAPIGAAFVMAMLPGAQGATPPTLAYVTGRDGITVIDTATDTVIDTIPACASAAVAVSGSLLYVPCPGKGVQVIDWKTKTLIATLSPTDSNRNIVHGDSQVAITPNGEFLYLTTSNGVSRFDTTTNQSVNHLNSGISRAVAIAPRGDLTFVQTWNGGYLPGYETAVPVTHVIGFDTGRGARRTGTWRNTRLWGRCSTSRWLSTLTIICI